MTPVSRVNEWLALMRAHEGAVTSREGQFFNHGQPVAGYLADTLADLIRTEHLALGRRPDPSGQQQVCVTRAGQARYAELNANGVRETRQGS